MLIKVKASEVSKRELQNKGSGSLQTILLRLALWLEKVWKSYGKYSLNTVYPKVAKRFIPCAIWVHITLLHSLNRSTIIAGAAELLVYI